MFRHFYPCVKRKETLLRPGSKREETPSSINLDVRFFLYKCFGTKTTVYDISWGHTYCRVGWRRRTVVNLIDPTVNTSDSKYPEIPTEDVIIRFLKRFSIKVLTMGVRLTKDMNVLFCTD